jgi:hypothetical protein
VYQLEFKFFFPLTEQIPLDLDYTECDSRQTSPFIVSYGGTGDPLLGIGTHQHNWVLSQGVSKISITADGLEFAGFKMPWYRKILFKLLGFNWRQ